MDTPVIRVGIIGAGFVGGALVELLNDESRHVALVDAATATIELVGVAVRDASKPRPGIPTELLTTDAMALASRADLDILVELAGGIEPARSYIEAALNNGVSVVTANKALMAESGTALAQLAHQHGADLFYEAAVGGAIPILRALRSSLAGERIERVMGIVNGTTNFILSKMTSEGRDYAEALGYAEADPTADVEGYDAAAKVQILASLAFGTALEGEEISREGIAGVRAVDVEFARRAGYVIKLLGVAARVGEHGVSRRVLPAMLPHDLPLAAVNGAMNAVFVEGTAAGPLMWLGQGAGGRPTATAVLGDVLDAARNRVSGRHDVPFSVDAPLAAVAVGEISSVFYLSLDVLDEPGVLASVVGVFGRHRVSIQSMEQSGVGDEARLSFLTHVARTSDGRSTLDGVDDVVTLQEGNTPLIRADRLSERLEADVWLKFEGLNPSGSFKDRGMTMAITKAKAANVRTVICGSTGNTSAAAAAYAAKAGMDCVVLVPEGKISLGKLAQAIVYGAQVIQIRGNFDQALNLARELTQHLPITIVNSINPDRIEGQKTGAFEIVDVLGRAPDVLSIPVGNAGNITAYWRGFTQYHFAERCKELPKMWGFQAAGAAPIVLGHPVTNPETIATAIRIGNPASWVPALEVIHESLGDIRAVTDDEIIDAYKYVARDESIFCEPASAASVAGIIKYGVPKDSTVVCVLTGNGLKDPDTAVDTSVTPDVVDATLKALLAKLS